MASPTQEYTPPCSPSRSGEYVVPTGTGFCKKPAAASMQAKEGTMRIEEQLVDLMKQQLAFSRRLTLHNIVDDAAELTKCARQKIYATFDERLKESGELNLEQLDEAITEAQEAQEVARLAEAEAEARAFAAWQPANSADDLARRHENQRLWAPYGNNGRPPWEASA